jgi:hypothetical protein
MLNYGEEIAYWYLRFNGFFLIDNFVIHHSKNVKHSSDIDIIAVRLPYVYEEIGGHPNDWDTSFFDPFNKNLPIGVLCEIKTGRIDIKKLFKPDNIKYAIGRFGFARNFEETNLVSDVDEQKLIHRDEFQIAKILFSNRKHLDNDRFYHCPLSHLQEFLQKRIKLYKEKYQDRMFFSSNLMQYLIDSEQKKRTTGVR